MNVIPNPPIIELQRVSCAHRPGGPDFLRDLSFSVQAGEWISLVGANGSGKSSLVKRLNGLLPASSGRIIIDGIELTARTLGDIRERIGMVFANPDNQFVGLNVADDIVFGLENRCLDRKEMGVRLERYASMLGIEAFLNRHPAELSGGQKQRVALAAVLALEPKILVLDEATSMLDEQAKGEILTVLRKMRVTGDYTLISVTHDHDEILSTDRMLALADGQLAADGAPGELLRDTALLNRLRLRPSFAMELAAELNRLGIPVPPQAGESELMEALTKWHCDSNK
jgi:energy-coupling factor transport system ATP-binding protein